MKISVCFVLSVIVGFASAQWGCTESYTPGTSCGTAGGTLNSRVCELIGFCQPNADGDSERLDCDGDNYSNRVFPDSLTCGGTRLTSTTASQICDSGNSEDQILLECGVGLPDTTNFLITDTYENSDCTGDVVSVTYNPRDSCIRESASSAFRYVTTCTASLMDGSAPTISLETFDNPQCNGAPITTQDLTASFAVGTCQPSGLSASISMCDTSNSASSLVVSAFGLVSLLLAFF